MRKHAPGYKPNGDGVGLGLKCQCAECRTKVLAVLRQHKAGLEHDRDRCAFCILMVENLVAAATGGEVSNE